MLVLFSTLFTGCQTQDDANTHTSHFNLTQEPKYQATKTYIAFTDASIVLGNIEITDFDAQTVKNLY